MTEEQQLQNKTSPEERIEPLPQEELQGGKVWEQRDVDFVVQGSQEDFSFGEEVEFEDFSFGELEPFPFKPQFTNHASKEQAVMASAKTGEPVELIKQELDSGNFQVLDNASTIFTTDLNSILKQEAEKAIGESETPEQVQDILKNLEQRLNRKPTLAEQRAAYVESVTRTSGNGGGSLDTNELHPILKETIRNNLLANDISKMQHEFDNSVSYLDMAVDFLELITPTGTASEEGLKYTSDIYDNLDKLESLPYDKQMALIEAMVDAAKNQETYLFNNNNSLIAGGQIDTIYNAVLQGARLKADGATEAEVGAMLETAFNGTLFVGEVASLAKGISQMGKFLMRRIHSRKNLAAAAKEQEELMQAVIHSEALHRLNPENAQYRMEGATSAPKIDEFSVTSIQDTSINPTGLRPNHSLFDTLYKFAPLKYNAVKGEKGVKGLVEETGLSNEEVAERLLPTPNEDTTQGFHNVPERRFLNDLIFVDASQHSVGQGLGRELEKPMGTSLAPDYSQTGFKHNNVKGSMGTFTFSLGDGAKAGFATAEEAEKAIAKAALGYEHRVVQKENGFFVEVEVDHYFNPYSDVAGLKIEGSTPSPAIKWALNRYRNVEEDLVRGLAAMKNVNRSTLQKMEDKAKRAIIGLSPEENKLLMDILAKGDVDEVEWTDLSRLNNDTDLNVPESVFKAYREIREVYDDIYIIRERNHYNKLRIGQQKYIDFEDGGDLGIGNAVPHKDIDVDVIYDPTTQTTISRADLNEDDIVVRMGAGRTFGDEVYTYARVQPEQIKPLVAGRTLNKRVGHIDRMYRDAGWIVQSPYVKRINGVDTPSMKVTHIVKTQKEAEDIAKEIDGAQAIASREKQSLESEIFGDSESVQFGYGGSHMKHRGEQVRGADGVEGAEVLNVFESLFNSIGSISSALDYNAFQALRIKFNKGFAEYLKENAATPFADRWEDMVSKDGAAALTANPKMKQELINHHAYLKSLRQFNRGKVFKAIDSVLSPILAPIKFDPNTQAAATSLQRLTSELYIVWNGLYQGAQNLIPVFYNLATGGLGAAKAIPMLPSIMLAAKTGNHKPLAILLGDDALAEELVTEMMTNGLVDAIGRSNDFLDLARREGASVPTAKTKVGSVIKGTGAGTKKALYDMPRKLSLGLQESAIVLNNSLAYLTEFNNLRASGRAFGGKAKAEISFQAQKRTQTQTSLDRFAYQDQATPVASMMQFMQAVHKFFLDAVIEPQWETIRTPINKLMKPVTDKHLGALGKNKGRYADTWNKAFVTSLVTYGMFGLEGGMGKTLGMALEDHIRSYWEPDEIPAILDGFLDGGLNTAINSTIDAEGSIDVNATMSPAAFVDMFSNLVFEDFPSMNMLGASGFAVGGVAESIYSTYLSVKAAVVTPEMEWDDAMNAAFLEAVENLKFMDTALKSYTAYWSERNASARSWSSDLKVTGMEAIAKNFGVSSELLADHFYRQKFGESNKTGEGFLAQKSTDTMMQNFAREVVGNVVSNQYGGEADPRLALEEINKIRSKWVSITKQLNDPKYHAQIERAFIERGLKFDSLGYEEYQAPYLRDAAHGNTTRGLKLLEQRAPEGEAKETIKFIREGKEIVEGR